MSPAPTNTAPATTAPTATATAVPTLGTASQPAPSTFPADSVIVTFKVVDEQYRVLVTDPATIAIARDLLAGKEAPSIPNGVVAAGDGGVNSPWTWHIDPATLDFADMTTEVCDGKPSFVEDGMVSGDRFCPWAAEVVSVEPATR